MAPITRFADRIHSSVGQLVPTPGASRRTAATTAIVLLLLASSVVQPVVAVQDDEGSIEIDHEGDEIRLEAAPNQTISGTTDLEPGTEVRVHVRSSERNFIKSYTTNVSADGSFEMTFDLSDLAAPSDVTAGVSEVNGSASDRVTGRVVAPGTETSDERIDLPTMTRVAQNGTANLTVTMPPGESVAVRIGDETKVNYELTALLEDADGDGEVALRFDTAAAGTADPTVSVGSGDRFEIAEPEPRLNDSLAPGNYDLSVAQTVGGDPVSLGTLVIEDGPSNATETERTTRTHESTAASDDFWNGTAPAVAGVVAILAGIGSLVLYRQ